MKQNSYIATISQTQINRQIEQTFQASATWGNTVAIGATALLAVAALVAFLIWRID